MTLDETFKAAKAGDLTEDTTYKVGEISRKTGLQKQPDGSWAPPKKTNYGKVTTNKNGEVGIQQTLGKGSKFEKFGSEKEAARALGNYTAGYNTTERSKEDPHSNEALLHKHWDKETEQIRKENKQADMKKEIFEYLSHTMARENAEAFLDKASPKMLRTMYNNLKYKIPGENKKLHKEEPAASEEKLNQIRTVHSSEKLGNGQTLELTESKKNGKFFVKIDGRPVSSWKTKEAAQKEFDAYKNGEDPAAARYNEIVGEYNKKHPENPMETKEPVSKSAASSEENSTMTHAKALADNEQKKQNEGQAYLEQSVSGYSDQSLKQAASTYTRNLEEFDDDIKSLQRRGLAPVEIAKRINSANFAKGALKAINAEIEARSKKNNPAASSQDAAYTAESVNAPRENLERKLTGDCKIRIRK